MSEQSTIQQANTETNKKPDPEWLTTTGLSKMLGGINVSTIRGWRLVGIGPPWVRLGGLVRYQRAAVERWIEAGGDRRGASAR